MDLYLIHVPFGFIPDTTSENPAKDADGSYVLDNTDLLAVWKVTFHLIFQVQYISKPVKFAHYCSDLNSSKQLQCWECNGMHYKVQELNDGSLLLIK